MREGISVEMSAADRARLEAVVADRNSPQKHVWRARIVLATADGLGTGEIVRRTGKSKPCVQFGAPLGRLAHDLLEPAPAGLGQVVREAAEDRKSTRLNSSHPSISYAVFCLKKKNKRNH